MKKRTIEISLETAKEWYKGDNEVLKNLALQAFNEKELQDGTCVKSWEEFCKKHNRNGEYYINQFSEATPVSDFCNYPRDAKVDKNLLATKKDAGAFLALIQLKRLRDQWWEAFNWKPDWKKVYAMKFCIYYHKDEIIITTECFSQKFLSFPTEELATQFLENFRDLIEKAKDLI